MSQPSTSAIPAEPAKIKRLSRLFKTIGHPVRLHILDLLLRNGPLPVKDIYAATAISQANASQHLRVLADVGLLDTERQGNNVLYFVYNEELSQLLEHACACSDAGEA